MPGKINKRGPVAPEMNITPLIDVVFLLIIFFMIVSKIVSDERTPMLVPQLHDPQTQELDAPRRVIVNVSREEPDIDQRRGKMAGPDEYEHLKGTGKVGNIRVGATKNFEPEEMEKLTKYLKADKQANENVEVLVRADSALYYVHVMPVVNAVTQAGISKINVVAYPKERPF